MGFPGGSFGRDRGRGGGGGGVGLTDDLTGEEDPEEKHMFLFVVVFVTFSF